MNSRKEYDIDIYAVESLYAPTNDILSDECEESRRAKIVVYRRLDDTDRRIILAYAELGNIRETARLFRVSTTTMWKRINEIREKIKEYLEISPT